MPKQRLPNHQDLIILFQTHSIAQLAEMFQVKENTIAKKLAEARRLHLNPNPLQAARRQQVKNLMAEGKSFGQIGRILGINAASARRYAINHGLYTPDPQFSYGLPIGCRQCVLMPSARGLCQNCHRRFHRRKKKNLVDYPDELLILDHPNYKVVYTVSHGYRIHCRFLDTVHIDQPNPLEKVLLDQLQRHLLIDLHNLSLQKERELAQEEPPNP